MTSSDPQQPGDGTYDSTVIRPVEPSPAGPDLTKRDDATQIAQPAASNPYAPPVDPYAANPYAANPYAQPEAPYTDPYAQPANPYAAPPQYPAYPGQNAPGLQAPGYPTPGSPTPGYPAAPGYPGYGRPVSSGTNGLAIASLVCGIVSIPLTCLYVGVLFGIAAVIMGVIAMKQVKETGQEGHGMALAGVITGGVGIALSLGYILLVIIGLSM